MTSTLLNIAVLVTGGAGFIGSHLVEKLVTLGAQVTVLDNLSTGNIQNLANVKDSITFMQGDITNFATCVQACQGKQFVFHLAAQTSVPESVEYPHQCHATNIVGTANILEAARVNNVSRVIFSSSSAVYGNHEGVCSENTSCKPTSPYGYSKWHGELLCQEYSTTYGLETVCLRYFNVFGQRQNPHGPYAGINAKLLWCMQTNSPITINGDGMQTRDFVSVEEIVRANITLALASLHPRNHDVFNIATGKSITLRELIAKIQQNFPAFNAPITYGRPRAGDITHSQADCDKYQNILKYS